MQFLILHNKDSSLVEKLNVLSVDTRDFWRSKEVYPNQRQVCHYFRNAETYVLIGDALDQGMIQLICGTAENRAIRIKDNGGSLLKWWEKAGFGRMSGRFSRHGMLNLLELSKN
jgi:hypothetical protein